MGMPVEVYSHFPQAYMASCLGIFLSLDWHLRYAKVQENLSKDNGSTKNKKGPQAPYRNNYDSRNILRFHGYSDQDVFYSIL